jgi:hypothetical protein
MLMGSNGKTAYARSGGVSSRAGEQAAELDLDEPEGGGGVLEAGTERFGELRGGSLVPA